MSTEMPPPPDCICMIINHHRIHSDNCPKHKDEPDYLRYVTPKMSEEEKKHVCRCIEQEGVDYCFDGYSDFKEIEDPKFHRLISKYLAARDALYDYIGRGE